MSRAFQKATAALLTILVTACGGGGGGSPAALGSTGTTTSTTSTAQGTTSTPGGTQTDNSGGSGTGGNTAGSTDPSTPFAAAVTAMPADGFLSNTVVFEVRGSGLENVELLPSTGYSPTLGRFTISPDKTSATLSFDTATLPNGTLYVRISAFDKPAGSTGASEIVAMAPHQWDLGNGSPAVPTSVPSATWMPRVLIALSNLPKVDPQRINTLHSMDDASFSNLVTNNWAQFEADLRFYVPVNVVFTFPTPLGFHAAWDACIGSPHNFNGCRDAVSYLWGQQNS